MTRSKDDEKVSNDNTRIAFILGEAIGYGIISGLLVSAQSTPDMTVRVSAGIAYMPNGQEYCPSIASLTINAADSTKPRTDLVYLDVNGIGYLAGALGTPAVTGTRSCTFINNFTANDTIKINGIVYIAVTATSTIPNSFVIGAKIQDSITSLAAAINSAKAKDLQYPYSVINTGFTVSTNGNVLTISEEIPGSGFTVDTSSTGSVQVNVTSNNSKAAVTVTPALPAGAIALAEIFVKQQATAITASCIKDKRILVPRGQDICPLFFPPAAAVRGLEVTATGAGRTVAISSGSVIIPDGREFAIAAVPSLTIPVIGTTQNYERADLIYVNTNGTIVLATGTPGLYVNPPALPAGCMALAELRTISNPTSNGYLVYENTIFPYQITDKRITVVNSQRNINQYYNIDLDYWEISNSPDKITPYGTENGINRAMNWAKNNGYSGAYLRAGTYGILPAYYWDIDSKLGSRGQCLPVPKNLRPGGERGIAPPSNFTLKMDPDCIIKVIPNWAYVYVALSLQDKENVTIIGGKIIGDKNEHYYRESGDADGMGIVIYRSRNIKIFDTIIDNCQTDGIFLDGGAGDRWVTNNIFMKDVISNGNGRQAMSVCVSGDNLVFEDCTFSNSSGASPELGVDIESGSLSCTNLIFRRCTFFGNNRGGLGNSDGAVRLENCTFHQGCGSRSTMGHVEIIDCTFDNQDDIDFYTKYKTRLAVNTQYNVGDTVYDDSTYAVIRGYTCTQAGTTAVANGTDMISVEHNRLSKTQISLIGQMFVNGTSQWKLTANNAWGSGFHGTGSLGQLSNWPTRANNTAYLIGNRFMTSTKVALVCTVPGTTGATEPLTNGVYFGDTITDGTVTWKVVESCVYAYNHQYKVGDQVQLNYNTWVQCTIAGISGTSIPSPSNLYLGDTFTDDTITWKIVNNRFPKGYWRPSTKYNKYDVIIGEDGVVVYICLTAGTTGAKFPNLKQLPINTDLIPYNSGCRIKKVAYDSTAPVWQPNILTNQGDKVNIGGSTWVYSEARYYSMQFNYCSGSTEPSVNHLARWETITDGSVVWLKVVSDISPLTHTSVKNCVFKNCNLSASNYIVQSIGNTIYNGSYVVSGYEVHSDSNIVRNLLPIATSSCYVNYLINTGLASNDKIYNSFVSANGGWDYSIPRLKLYDNLHLDNCVVVGNAILYNSQLIVKDDLSSSYNNLKGNSDMKMMGGYIDVSVNDSQIFVEPWHSSILLDGVQANVRLGKNSSFIKNWNKASDGNYLCTVSNCVFSVTPTDNYSYLFSPGYSDANLNLINNKIFNKNPRLSFSVILPSKDTVNTFNRNNFYDTNIYSNDIDGMYNIGGYGIRTTIDSNGIPVKGNYALGTRIMNITPAVGSPSAWVVTTAGWAYSTIRANSTLYTLGTFVRWPKSSNIYECVAAGTSASSPATAGSGTVTDGTVIWLYRGNTTAVFTKLY